MAFLLIATGVYLSLRLRFLQFTKIKLVWKAVVSSFQTKTKGISPFKAAATALAGTMGTGNIVGVATAIVAGGPGAIFWMWVSAFFGMATKFCEVVLAIVYRKDGSGGPMYYLKYGLKSDFLAKVYALFLVASSMCMGNMVQSNSLASSANSCFGIDKMLAGIIAAAIVGVVAMFGAKGITNAAGAVLPALTLFYLVGCCAVIVINRQNISAAFEAIYCGAFGIRPLAGAGMGLAIRYGVSRGVFTNEAGLGSSSIAHASADCKSPQEQGLWGIFEIFADTIVTCTLTALAILTSGAFSSDPNTMTSQAFETAFGSLGGSFVEISVMLFALCTLFAWCFYGEKVMYFLRPRPSTKYIYRSFYMLFIVIGSVLEVNAVWEFSDLINAFIAVPNVIGLVALVPVVQKQARFLQKDQQLGRKLTPRRRKV